MGAYEPIYAEVLEQRFDRGIVAKLRYHAKRLLLFCLLQFGPKLLRNDSLVD